MNSTIIEYRYRSTRGVFGWFQCDREDFLKMFHNRRFQECLYWIDVRVNRKYRTNYQWIQDLYHYDHSINKWTNINRER